MFKKKEKTKVVQDAEKEIDLAKEAEAEVRRLYSAINNAEIGTDEYKDIEESLAKAVDNLKIVKAAMAADKEKKDVIGTAGVIISGIGVVHEIAGGYFRSDNAKNTLKNAMNYVWKPKTKKPKD